jgi:hypothetical protein
MLFAAVHVVTYCTSATAGNVEHFSMRRAGVCIKAQVTLPTIVTMKGITMENYFGKQPCLRILASKMCGDLASQLCS